ncbi:MAG: ABC-F family ATP-binding cassette domain-containing protein [Saprospiraceae bacterium]
MLTATNIYIQYGDRRLLNKINLIIKNKDKVGLVGRNGAGKSTLLKILSGEIIAHEGDVARPNGSTLAFLHQEILLDQTRTVIDAAMSAFDELKELEQKIDTYNIKLGERTDYESDGYAKLIQDFTDVNERYDLMGGATAQADAEKILKGLGFKQKDFQRQIAEFSGGWQMRVELAKMLLSRPDYLLLDEPTNHLDIESIIWLESFLKNYEKSVIVISHDQQFLDNTTNRTVEIELGQIQDYKANYSKYLELRIDRKEKMQSAYVNQQKVLAEKERTITRFMAKATKTKMAQSMKKQLDKIERIELEDEDIAAMNLKFLPAPRSGQIVSEGKNITKRYGTLQVLDNVDFILERGERVAFVGQNGQGKTTLAKILTKNLKPTEGDVTLGHNVQLGYYAQDQSDALDPNITLLQTMENHSPPELRTKLRSILGAFMFSGEDVEKKVSVLSGGERARLALACLLLQPMNLLILDEPTNHLDIISKKVLKQALKDYNGSIIVVSHDREFLSDLTGKTLEFRNKKLYTHLGDVNYFLRKRALDNMRDVEMQAVAKKIAKEKSVVSPNESKAIQRKIENLERKIEKLEEEILVIEGKMGVEGFYQSEEANNTISKHQSKKKELDLLMQQWEEVEALL